jgi:hypothetical protein
MKLAWIAAAAGIAAARGQNGAELKVYVTGNIMVPAHIRAVAQGVASRVFDKIGIHLKWHYGPPGAGVRLEQVIRLQYESCQRPEEGSAGTAQPYEGSTVVIYYDRLRWAEQHLMLAPRLLGHVLAHEIAHNLEGIARHSDAGMMKAAWTARDYEEMTLRNLPFEPLDIELIQRGMRMRAGEQAGAEFLTARAVMAQPVEEPDARALPIALHGVDGDLQHLRDLVFLQAAEETQLDDLRLARVES